MLIQFCTVCMHSRLYCTSVHTPCLYCTSVHVVSVYQSQEWPNVASCCCPAPRTLVYCTSYCSTGGAGMGPFFVWSMMAYTVWCPAAWMSCGTQSVLQLQLVHIHEHIETHRRLFCAQNRTNNVWECILRVHSCCWLISTVDIHAHKHTPFLVRLCLPRCRYPRQCLWLPCELHLR